MPMQNVNSVAQLFEKNRSTCSKATYDLQQYKELGALTPKL